MRIFPVEVVFPLVGVFGLLGLYAFWSYSIGDREAKRIERSQNWPETRGLVKTSFAKRMHITVVYEYVAEGHVYTGEHKIVFPQLLLAKGSQGIAIGKDVREEIANFPPGANVIVRYNPKNAAQSVLYSAGELRKKDPAETASIAPNFRMLD